MLGRGPWLLIIVFTINMKKELLTISILATLMGWTGSCGRKGCSVASTLNPESACRVLDVRGDKRLVEYFDVDTNELELYIQQDGKDIEIIHPYGRVGNYSDRIDSNSITFDNLDPKFVIVNGERFEIIERK